MGRILSESEVLGAGETATVFAVGDDRVLKLYRAGGPAGWQAGLARLRDEEVRAYKISTSDPQLAGHIPHFYGIEEVGAVVDSCGLDISERFLLPLAISLERLHGSITKVQDLAELPSYIREILEAFEAKGIYAADASVYRPDDAERCKFIDLTTSLGNLLACDLVKQNTAGPEELERWFRGE